MHLRWLGLLLVVVSRAAGEVRVTFLFLARWKNSPVFKIFEEGLDSTSVAGMTPNLSNQSLRELFEKGMQHLKQCASYLFANPKREPTSWTIAYTGQRCYPGR